VRSQPGKLVARNRIPPLLRSRWVNVLVSSDPGHSRLRHATESVLGIALALVAESVFVHGSGALLRQPGPGASTATLVAVAAANHDLLAIAMLLGAILGLISSMSLTEVTAKGQLITLLILPVPMISALALGITLGGHRAVALAVIALVLAFGTYLRRFGPRGFVVGQLLFVGYFVGFSLHSAVTIGDLGWLAAEVGVALIVAAAVRFTLFYPHPAKTLERTQRSFDAQARQVAILALELFDTPASSERRIRRMHRRLLRLNESALMIDAQLGESGAVPAGYSGERLHQRLFDIELALTNITRFAQAMARQQLPTFERAEIRLALLDIVCGDNEGAQAHAANLSALDPTPLALASGDNVIGVIVHRFATSVADLAEAMTEWMAVDASRDDSGSFTSSVSLVGGWLPGSAQVSSTASLEGGNRWGTRVPLARNVRNAIQMGVAAGVALALGDLISPDRFYWAVIAAFITFMGAHNAGEQIRKAFFRVGGTVIGIGIGSLAVRVIGHHTYWSITIILISLFLGLYLFRISYAFLAIAITITVSQLYQQLGEFTNALLLVRLELTAVGAAVAIVVVMVVLPLHTRQVLRVALRQHVEAVGRLVLHASRCMLGQDDGLATTLRSDARAVDAAYQVLVATAQPLRRTLAGNSDEEITRALHLASASRNYSRNLIVDLEGSRPVDVDSVLDVDRASATLHESIDLVARALTGPRNETYTRSSALFDQAESNQEVSPQRVDATRLAFRDFRLIDGTMARMAELIGLKITDFDTVGVKEVSR
jgi:uncharacterized membrane protein YgaE (UPF0421/DUF939 family)